MAAVRILVDTDVFIDYFNAGQSAGVLDDRQATICNWRHFRRFPGLTLYSGQ